MAAIEDEVFYTGILSFFSFCVSCRLYLCRQKKHFRAICSSAPKKITEGYSVLLEGMDLSGKSSAFEGLKKYFSDEEIEHRCSRNSLIPESENPLAVAAHILRTDPEVNRWETGALFYRSHMHEVGEFKGPKKGMFHLQDSCFLRTISYNAVLKTRFGDESLEDLLYKNVVPLRPYFDVIIVLRATMEKRVERLKQRENESLNSCDFDDRKVGTNPEIFSEMEEELWAVTKNLYEGAVQIDTSDLSKQDVLTKIIRTIEEILHLKSN